MSEYPLRGFEESPPLTGTPSSDQSLQEHRKSRVSLFEAPRPLSRTSVKCSETPTSQRRGPLVIPSTMPETTKLHLWQSRRPR